MKIVTNGAVGELLAARLLRAKGYLIVTANYRTRFGEIDLIASDLKYIVFVEVKTRSDHALYLPREAVSPVKQKKILLAAKDFLKKYRTDMQPRFDVIEVWLPEDGKYPDCREINHIISAFDFDDLHGNI
ncbi:MAG: YraN family protein [Clostridia bacterium]|nr:YraN family protein [Clostridia bacterium]